jgi:hypothetical protein
MTPKEKAKELVDKFEKLLFNKFTTDEDWVKCVECALISLELTNEFADDSYRSCYGYKHTYEYLEQVKQEIEKL